MKHDLKHSHLALKLVSVLFAALGLVFPTFNFGFYAHVSSTIIRSSFKVSNLEIFLLILLLL
jgi:hypothetical protein